MPLIDGVAEIIDARIPISSRNPDLDEIVKDKPRIVLMNKADIADAEANKKWIEFFKERGTEALPVDCKTGKGLGGFTDKVNAVMGDRLQKFKDKGMTGRTLRLMVVGIPNVGKSSFINRMAKNNKAKVADRFFYKKDTTGKASKVQIRDETAYSQIAVCNATLALEQTEQMPSFQSGDMKAFHNWVNSQIRYPAEAFKNNLGGKVVAQFTVDQAGSVGDIKILQSPDKCFSDEVTRILESSPKWTPGRDEKGDAVKVSLVIPVDFRMTAEKPSEN